MYEPKELRPERKDIIAVKADWTKGRTYFYLVDYSDPERDWISGYKIVSNGCYATKATFIPENYLQGQYNYLRKGFVNVFTGRSSIHVSAIQEIISSVPDKIFNHILAMDFAVRMGSYTKDLFGNYIINDVPFPISINARFSDIINGIGSIPKIGEVPTTTLIHPVKEEPKKEPKPEPSKKPEPVKEPEVTTEDPVSEPEPEIEEVQTNETKEEEVIEDTPNESSEDQRSKIIEHYKGLSSADERLDYIFELFAEGGLVSVSTVFNELINFDPSKRRRSTKNSIVITRDQFLYAVNESIENIMARSDWRNNSGDSVELLYNAAKRLKKQCCKLYYNEDRVSRQHVDTMKKKAVIDMYTNKKLSIKKIAEITSLNAATVTNILTAAGLRDKVSIAAQPNPLEYFQEIPSIMKAELPDLYEDLKPYLLDMQKAAKFLKKNGTLLGTIITSNNLDASKITELSDFDGNLDVLKFMAIKCSYRNIFVYEAALLFPQFILNHRPELIALFQIDKRSVITKTTMNTAKQMKNLSIIRTSNVKFDVRVEELKDQEDSVYKALHEFLVYLVNTARVNRKEFHDSSIAKYINSRFGIPMSYMDYYYKNYKN